MAVNFRPEPEDECARLGQMWHGLLDRNGFHSVDETLCFGRISHIPGTERLMGFRLLNLFFTRLFEEKPGRVGFPLELLPRQNSILRL